MQAKSIFGKRRFGCCAAIALLASVCGPLTLAQNLNQNQEQPEPTQTDGDFSKLPAVMLDKLNPDLSLFVDDYPWRDETQEEIAAQEAESLRIDAELEAKKAAATAAGLCDVENPPISPDCIIVRPARSFGSRHASRKAAPFQVQFVFSQSGASRERLRQLFPTMPEWEARHACGGSIIASGWALTAAHCFAYLRPDGTNGVDAASYAIRVDVDDISSDAKARPIQDIILHPKYSKRTNVNDVALVRFNQTAFEAVSNLTSFDGTRASNTERLRSVDLFDDHLIIDPENGPYIRLDIDTRRLSLAAQNQGVQTANNTPSLSVDLDPNGKIYRVTSPSGDRSRVGRTRLRAANITANEGATHAVIMNGVKDSEVWDLVRRERIARFEPSPNFQYSDVIFSKDKAQFHLLSREGISQIRQTNNGDLIKTINHGLPTRVARKGPRNLISIEGNKGTATVLDIATGTVRHTLNHGGSSVWTSLSDTHVLTWTEDGRIRLFDLVTGAEILHYVYPEDTPILGQIAPIPREPTKMQKVILADADPQPSPETWLTAFGWGKTRSTTLERSTAILRQLSLNPISWDQCNTLNGTDAAATDASAFCAIGPSRKTCRGDSGGPLLLGDSLVGIVSRGSARCLDDGRPTKFASVAAATEWIKSVVCASDNANSSHSDLCSAAD